MTIWISIGILLAMLSFGSSSDLQSKLDALESAHNAGILTDEEYASKKAELEAPQLDEATKQKLAALDAAYQAGVLSDEEYARKKAELLGQTAGARGTSIGLNRYSDPQGRFQFNYPKGWNTQGLQDGQGGIGITRGKAALNVMPLPDGANAQQVLDSIAEQIGGQWQNYREIRRGQKKVGSQSAPMVEFSGVNPQGMQAHAQTVVFVSGIKGFVFVLVAPESDPQNSFTAIQPAWETLLSSFTIAGKKGKSYQHPAGFSFSYPESWTVADQEGTLQLTPPDASSTAEGPTELYFIAVEDISDDNVQRPDDPTVLEYLDQQVKSLSQALQRTGSTSPADMRSGKGVIAEWGAKTAKGDVRARAFVGIINKNLVVLVAMGLKERVEARDQDLRQIFASLGVGGPQPSTAGVATDQPMQAGIAASSNISPDEAGDPGWGFKFKPPQGWKFQKNPQAIILGHDTIAGVILVIPHTSASFQEVQAQMQSGLTEETVQLFPTGGLQQFGNNAVAGDYTGTFNGQQVKARGVGTLSPYGGGAYIIALTIPDKYGAQLSGAADAIARSMQYFKVEVSDLMQHFAGTWVTVTKSTQTTVTLSPNGEYYYGYEASYSGGFSDSTGADLGGWGTASQNQDRGRWTVRGTKERGTLILTAQNGSQSTLEYQVHVEKGETYWNEYYFDGDLYGKQR